MNLEEEAKRLLDTPYYHFSQHWERDNNGKLSTKGLKQILKDAEIKVIVAESDFHLLQQLTKELTQLIKLQQLTKELVQAIKTELKKREDEGEQQ